jgi:hypothetical protein
VFRDRPEPGRRLAHQLADRIDSGRLLDRRLERASPPETLDIPRIELAHVPGGAVSSEVLDRTVDHPVELGEDLVAVGLAGAFPEELLEEPRIAERPARQQHGRRTRGLERRAGLLGRVQPPGQEDRDGELLDECARERVVQ